MEKFRLIILALLMMAGMSSYTALALTPFEQSAQTELISGLTKKGYKPAIDDKNGNILINKGENTFWISVKGLRMPLLYTVNIKGYVFNKPSNDFTIEERREIASRTAWATDKDTECKVVYDNGEVRFFMPIYASSSEDVVNVIDKVFSVLADAHKTFTSLLPKKQSEYASENSNLLKMEGKDYVVVEPVFNLPSTSVKCAVNGFSVRVVDSFDKEVIGYDKSIRKDQALYIQESVNISSEEAGICALGVKIYNPAGKLMVPFPSARYTTINIIDVKKNKKGAQYQLEKFGYDKAGKWIAGEYRIEFVINGKVVYNGTFTIL